MNYDLVICGGGTSGIATAYIASKYGLKTLLVEKTDTLGGAITQGLVIPVMKVDTSNINTEFFTDLLFFADKYQARHTYLDGNEGWFNQELLKIVFDDMLDKVNCTVLFASELISCNYDHNFDVFKCNINHKMLSLYVETKYIVDATSNCEIFKILNYELQKKSEKFQTPTLRFIVGNINIDKFADWLEEYDTDRNVTTIHRTSRQIYLSTAYTADVTKKWALRPLFTKAVDDGVLETEDTSYFQVFSIPQMTNSLAFNCPRILIKDNENPSDPFVYSNLLKQGRIRIYRLFNFCKKYLPGFEKSYITNIAGILGIRESERILGEYTTTIDDIKNAKKFDNIALACDYPVDIHTNNAQNDKFEHIKHLYYLPIESLICKVNNHLYAVGRHLSTDFEAQSALRTQMSCFSMGEAAAKDIIKKINN